MNHVGVRSGFSLIISLRITMVLWHYGDVIMGAIASLLTSLTIVYSTVYSDADQRKHQSSASLAFVRGIHRGPMNSPHKWPVTRKMFSFDDVIMDWTEQCEIWHETLNIMVCMDRLLSRGMVCNSPLEAQGLSPKEAASPPTHTHSSYLLWRKKG